MTNTDIFHFLYNKKVIYRHLNFISSIWTLLIVKMNKQVIGL